MKRQVEATKFWFPVCDGFLVTISLTSKILRWWPLWYSVISSYHHKEPFKGHIYIELNHSSPQHLRLPCFHYHDSENEIPTSTVQWSMLWSTCSNSWWRKSPSILWHPIWGTCLLPGCTWSWCHTGHDRGVPSISCWCVTNSDISIGAHGLCVSGKISSSGKGDLKYMLPKC